MEQRQRHDLVDRHDADVAQAPPETNWRKSSKAASNRLPRRAAVGGQHRHVGPQAAKRLGPARSSTSGCTLPSAAVCGSSAAVVTNSASTARSAGKRTSITDGACTHRLAASMADAIGMPAKQRRVEPPVVAAGWLGFVGIGAASMTLGFAQRWRTRVRPAMPVGDRARRRDVSGSAGGPSGEQFLHVVGQLCFALRRCSRPASEPTANRRESRACASLAWTGFGVEMPDARVAKSVGVRIARPARRRRRRPSGSMRGRRPACW